MRRVYWWLAIIIPCVAYAFVSRMSEDTVFVVPEPLLIKQTCDLSITSGMVSIAYENLYQGLIAETLGVYTLIETIFENKDRSKGHLVVFAKDIIEWIINVEIILRLMSSDIKYHYLTVDQLKFFVDLLDQIHTMYNRAFSDCHEAEVTCARVLLTNLQRKVVLDIDMSPCPIDDIDTLEICATCPVD